MTNEHESNLQEELWQCTLCPAAFGLRPDLMEHHAFTHNKLSIHKLNIHSGRGGEESEDLTLRKAEYKDSLSSDVTMSKESNSEEHSIDHHMHEEVYSKPPKLNDVDNNVKLKQDTSAEYTRNNTFPTAHGQRYRRREGSFASPPCATF